MRLLFSFLLCWTAITLVLLGVTLSLAVVGYAVDNVETKNPKEMDELGTKLRRWVNYLGVISAIFIVIAMFGWGGYLVYLITLL